MQERESALTSADLPILCCGASMTYRAAPSVQPYIAWPGQRGLALHVERDLGDERVVRLAAVLLAERLEPPDELEVLREVRVQHGLDHQRAELGVLIGCKVESG